MEIIQAEQCDKATWQLAFIHRRTVLRRRHRYRVDTLFRFAASFYETSYFFHRALQPELARSAIYKSRLVAAPLGCLYIPVFFSIVVAHHVCIDAPHASRLYGHDIAPRIGNLLRWHKGAFVGNVGRAFELAGAVMHDSSVNAAPSVSLGLFK